MTRYEDVRFEQIKPVLIMNGSLDIDLYQITIKDAQTAKSNQLFHSLILSVDKSDGDIMICYRHFLAIKISFLNQFDSNQAFTELQKHIQISSRN